jgi:putative NADH-flavin reductase
MKLIVFGANGRIGRLLVEQGLEGGHDVTAFVRTTSSIATTHPRLRVFAGDVKDAAAVQEAARGHDVALSAIGHRDRKNPDNVYSCAAKSYAAALSACGVTRLVAMSAFVGESSARAGFVFRTLIRPLLLESVFGDLEEADRIYATSALEWTTVRASRLVDGDRTGCYRAGVGLFGTVTSHIARADVAEFMLREAACGNWKRASPELLY